MYKMMTISEKNHIAPLLAANSLISVFGKGPRPGLAQGIKACRKKTWRAPNLPFISEYASRAGAWLLSHDWATARV